MTIYIKRIQAPIIVGLLLLMLILPQLALAAGPAMSPPVVQDITSTSATIYWTTNNYSSSRVNYGTNSTLGMSVSDSSMVTTHFIFLTSLTPNTTYYFETQSTDATGTATNNNSGAYYQFKTLQVTSYNITIEPVCGVCGELIPEQEVFCGEVIGVTALVVASGTYYIRWDSATGMIVGTFTATGAGSYTLTFFLPQSTKGIHYVYLTIGTQEKAKDDYEVFPSVKMDSINIPPDEGPVGTNVTLNGYGFTASQQLQIKFKDSVIKTATANATGSWNYTYIIPATPAGGYTFDVEAKEGTVWVNWVSKYFKVTPQISVTPGSQQVGRTIKIEGTGFYSKEKDIKVTFDSEVVKTIPYYPVSADENGSWGAATIVVPPVPSGHYIITASGESTRARNVPPIDFIVGAGILVEPSSAYVGDRIYVAGGGFASQETGIKVYFDGKVVNPTAITANITGCWETSFTLEASASGSHSVSASGDITKPAVSNTLNTKTRIESLSPIEGYPGDSVTIMGSGFGGNKKLTVTLGGIDAPLAGDVQTQFNGDVRADFIVPKSNAGKQTVKVSDDGGATASIDFTVMKKVLTTPLPTSPKDSTLRSRMVIFQWQGITGNNITYTLEISDTADFKSGLNKQSIGELRYQLTEEEALSNGTYYWRIKAVDKYGNESLWSSPNSFKVSPIPTWVWVIVGLVVLTILMVVAYRETKFKVTE